jgi:hypothetical protein
MDLDFRLAPIYDVQWVDVHPQKRTSGVRSSAAGMGG